jgi:hypothetical protein
MKLSAIACAILATGSVAMAQTPSPTVAPGDMGSRPPGDLVASDVTNKWLLDANGEKIGWIDGVVDQGSMASVRTPDGKHVKVELRRLSLGNGPNTVIQSGHSDADNLNKLEMQQSIPRRN